MNILYLMHIDWDWIFQRPHIFANKLSEKYKCRVIFPKGISGKETVVKRNARPDDYAIIYRLPLQGKCRVLEKISDFFAKKIIGNVKSYDMIWICHPTLWRLIPRDYSGRIVYDCMDNHVAMATLANRSKVQQYEYELAERADVILVSSLKLKELMKQNEKTILVRNGYKESYVFPVKEVQNRRKYVIGYFGTVAGWFDFELLENSLIERDDIEYRIIGPYNGEKKRTGIYFEGAKEHEELLETVKDYDALIMPFVVNDIILAVDPVKLYEYISFGKCVISVYYPEIERFKPFVYFYSTQEEYNDLLCELADQGFPVKYTDEERKEFLEKNTWEQRFDTIQQGFYEKGIR